MADEESGNLGELSWDIRAQYSQLASDIAAAQAQLDEFYEKNDGRALKVAGQPPVGKQPDVLPGVNDEGRHTDAEEIKRDRPIRPRVDTTDLDKARVAVRELDTAIETAKRQASGLVPAVPAGQGAAPGGPGERRDERPRATSSPRTPEGSQPVFDVNQRDADRTERRAQAAAEKVGDKAASAILKNTESVEKQQQRQAQALDAATLRRQVTTGTPTERLAAYDQAIARLTGDSVDRQRLLAGRDNLSARIATQSATAAKRATLDDESDSAGAKQEKSRAQAANERRARQQRQVERIVERVPEPDREAFRAAATRRVTERGESLTEAVRNQSQDYRADTSAWKSHLAEEARADGGGESIEQQRAKILQGGASDDEGGGHGGAGLMGFVRRLAGYAAIREGIGAVTSIGGYLRDGFAAGNDQKKVYDADMKRRDELTTGTIGSVIGLVEDPTGQRRASADAQIESANVQDQKTASIREAADHSRELKQKAELAGTRNDFSQKLLTINDNTDAAKREELDRRNAASTLNAAQLKASKAAAKAEAPTGWSMVGALLTHNYAGVTSAAVKSVQDSNAADTTFAQNEARAQAEYQSNLSRIDSASGSEKEEIKHQRDVEIPRSLNDNIAEDNMIVGGSSPRAVERQRLVDKQKQAEDIAAWHEDPNLKLLKKSDAADLAAFDAEYKQSVDISTSDDASNREAQRLTLSGESYKGAKQSLIAKFHADGTSLDSTGVPTRFNDLKRDDPQYDALYADRRADFQSGLDVVEANEQKRQAISGSTQSQLTDELNHDPLAAQLEGIRGAFKASHVGEDPKSADYQRDAVTEHLQEQLTHQHHDEQGTRITENLATQKTELDAMIGVGNDGQPDESKAQAAGTLNEFEHRAQDLSRAGYKDQAATEMSNGIEQLQLEKKDYLRGFHGVQFDPHLVDTSNPRNRVDVGKRVADFNNAIADAKKYNPNDPATAAAVPGSARADASNGGLGSVKLPDLQSAMEAAMTSALQKAIPA